MTQQFQNKRWIDNPERRVGQQQLLRATLASMSESDPLYREYRAMLEERQPAPRSRNTHS